MAADGASQTWSFAEWPLRAKLAAALIFPVLLAFVLGGLRVRTEFDQARQFSSAAESTLLLRPVIEYNLAVQRLAASTAPGGEGIEGAAAAYDKASAKVTAALQTASVSDTVATQTKNALRLGKGVRSAVSQTGSQSVVIDRSASTASLVSSVVGDLGLNDVASVKTLVALQDTIAAQRAMTGQQLNLANKDDASGAQNAVKLVGAEASFVARLKDEAGAPNSSDVRQLINENYARSVYLQGGSLGTDQLGVVGDGYKRSNTAYASMVNRQLSGLESTLRAETGSHRAGALFNIGLVIGSLVLALAIVLALLRSLLVPLRAVRRGALEIARHKLPEAVRRIRDGEDPPPFEPIPVHTSEEMGQLARAVDDLHQQALSLAGDQARLRVQVSHMFETLSRRSTSLIDQQLTLIEHLERDEEDPQRLQSLFRLDHLAARMRRNSDSLLVLAGTSTRRGGSRSISVSDAIRAAVSEVEEYQRIDIGETSDDQVLAAVGSDLIHMVAEIVDNALSYSPPTTRVAIRGARTSDGGLLVEVQDNGLGMPASELAALNERLANGGDVTTDTARRMGLFVVGTLAKRHGIGVRLRLNTNVDRSGTTVSVHLPAALLADSGNASSPAGAVPAGQARQGVAPKVNGSPAPASSPAQRNGSAAPASSAAAPASPAAAASAVSAQEPPVMGPNGLPVRKPRVPVTPVAPEAPAASAGTGAETPPQDDAPAAGALPRRKPMATGITEHTGTPATRAEAAAAAAEDGGRRWLRMPNRRAAEPEPETQDSDVEHRMPANLSAWLDHRAKLEAARAHLSSASEAAESEGVTSGHAGVLQPEPPAAQGSEAMASSPSLFEHASATNHGVQYAPVAEAAQQAPTEEPPQRAWPEAPPQQAWTEVPPQQAWAEVPPQEAQADVAPQAPAAPAAVEEQVSLLPTGLPRRRPGASGVHGADGADAPQAPAPSMFGTPTAPASIGVDPDAARRPLLPVRTPGASGVSTPASATPRSQEDTPIFRAMGSPWLSTSDGEQVDSSSSSGLPMRRPGGHLVPDAAEDASPAPQPAARKSRDPEAIRRSLNRHQSGVNSARAQDPNEPTREEADVPH